MSEAPPLAFTWDGEAMYPKHPRLADRHYVVGETYTLEPREDRSMRSHAHYFACIAEAHNNLPEELAERFPTPEALRKFALVKAGFRDERSVVCGSKAEALRVAAVVEDVAAFAMVVVNAATVTIFTPKSQSVRAMGKAEFQRSKDAVLTVLAQMIGTTPVTLQQNAEQAA